jgi:hypothetical protein
MPTRLDIPPVYFLASGVLMLLLHLGLPGPQVVSWPWRWLLPILGGVALAVAGKSAFQRAGTAVPPFSEPSALVTKGPFTRNAMCPA